MTVHPDRIPDAYTEEVDRQGAMLRLGVLAAYGLIGFTPVAFIPWAWVAIAWIACWILLGFLAFWLCVPAPENYVADPDEVTP
ncbi:MAG: hypothetical protein AAGA17_00340 [Actinomycetota bacterium]